MGLGPVILGAPMVLLALAFLPVLWWLLRVTPPPPRSVSFPPVRLLAGLEARAAHSARTPWWILLLRLAIAALAVIGLAHPLIVTGEGAGGEGGEGALLIVIDDGFAAAPDWGRRMGALDTLIDRAERRGRPVSLLLTAPPEDGGPMTATSPRSAGEVRVLARSLKPRPWASDRAAAASALAGLAMDGGTRAVWLSDGVDDGHAKDVLSALQRFQSIDVVTEAARARLLLPPSPEVGDLILAARRPSGARGEERLYARALDVSGQVLAREPLHFGVDSASASARMSLPAELRGRLARLDLEDVASAASVVLVDEQWGRRPVGLVSGSPLKADLPLLGDVYYLERALSPRFETRRGEIGELLRRELSMLVLADVGRLDPAESAAVLPWMDKGGILVRFAGPRLAAEAGEPLPVRLRAGERTAGGALTWNQPLALAPFEDATPFAGLAVPPDVRVSTQVLAEPGPDLAARTWARLSDGTPLVTAERRGQGWLVLVHATANAEWSNLALSGLFEAMMERLALLGRGTVEGETQPLPPLRTLDGFGREGTPPGTALPIPAAAFASVVPGPGRPPGVYGRADAQRALNLSAAVQTLDSIARPPAEARVYGFDHLGREIDLKPWFLAAALGLFVLDHGVALWLGRALILILVLFPRDVRAGGEDPFALAAALQPRLAYVRTGDAGTDGASRLGLAALTGVLEERTAAVLGPPMEVDVERDPLLFFPLLYWPLPTPPLSADGAVATKVEDYLRHGGMIVFDTRDSAAGSDSLRELARVVDIPPLTRIPSDHVLGRSFYLLRDFSGRVAGGEVWVAADPEGNDGVSPVIVAGNDLAGAWARGEGGGKPLFPVIPGGEMQRESAYRLGVNLVMYALTGNYKSDQVHLPAIMERLSR